MAVSLSIADNADGTGATATIAGGNAGDTNVVFTVAIQLLIQGILGPAWINQGSLVGNGNLALKVYPGYYWAYLQNTTVGGVVTLSIPQYFAANLAAQAVQTRIRQAVVARFQGLNLKSVVATDGAKIPANRIYSKMMPGQTTVEYPCVMVTEEGEAETEITGTNARDDLGHPIHVMIYDNVDPNDDTRLPNYERWREQLQRSLRSQRLFQVPEHYQTILRNKIMIDPRTFSEWYRNFQTGFTAVFKTREVRGT